MTWKCAHDKGRCYLDEGRLTIRTATRELGVVAVVRGDSGDVYRAAWSPALGWSCNSPARADQCEHLTALRLITTANPEPGA